MENPKVGEVYSNKNYNHVLEVLEESHPNYKVWNLKHDNSDMIGTVQWTPLAYDWEFDWVKVERPKEKSKVDFFKINKEISNG